VTEYERSPVMLRSESPSGMFSKLRTVAASNNRDHAPQSLCYCSFVRPTYMWCCSSRTSHSWLITHSSQRQRRGCKSNNRCYRATLQTFSKKVTSAIIYCCKFVQYCYEINLIYYVLVNVEKHPVLQVFLVKFVK